MAATAKQVVLASASAARASLLKAAGVLFTVDPADIDEGALKQQAREAGHSALVCALALASEKASVVSRRHPDVLVIGGDQVLAAGADWFDKPRDIGEARMQLRSLRGRSHTLATAVCVATAGSPVWRATSVPKLTMRRFSDDFLAAYLAMERESVLASVGAYRLEGRGAQLFSRIAGDHFAVLGLPLIELLGFLRERGILAT